VLKILVYIFWSFLCRAWQLFICKLDWDKTDWANQLSVTCRNSPYSVYEYVYIYIYLESDQWEGVLCTKFGEYMVTIHIQEKEQEFDHFLVLKLVNIHGTISLEWVNGSHDIPYCIVVKVYTVSSNSRTRCPISIILVSFSSLGRTASD